MEVDRGNTQGKWRLAVMEPRNGDGQAIDLLAHDVGDEKANFHHESGDQIMAYDDHNH